MLGGRQHECCGWQLVELLECACHPRLGDGITKVIQINLEELGGQPCLTSQRYVHYHHGFSNVMREDNIVIHTMLCDVSGRLSHRAEMGLALNPPHLNCRWNHIPHAPPPLLGENTSKVVAVGFLDNETPESLMSSFENRMCNPAGVSHI